MFNSSNFKKTLTSHWLFMAIVALSLFGFFSQHTIANNKEITVFSFSQAMRIECTRTRYAMDSREGASWNSEQGKGRYKDANDKDFIVAPTLSQCRDVF